MLCPDTHLPTPADWRDEMSVSASEIEKAKSRTKPGMPRHYTEEYRLEAIEYYRKARKVDPKKSIRECAAKLGINDKTLNDWIIKHSKTKRVTQVRTDEHKQLDAVNRRIHELESENKFLKKRQPSSPEASVEGQVLAHAGEEGNLQCLDDGARTGGEQVRLLQMAQGQRR